MRRVITRAAGALMHAVNISLVVLLVVTAASAQSARRRAVGRVFPMRPCSPGMVVFAPGLGDFVLDGSNVYFGAANGGFLRVPRDGGVAPTLLTRVEGPELYWMHVDATDLYFAGIHGDTSADIYSISKSGAAVPRIVSHALVTPSAFAADEQSIYWVSAGTYVGETLLADGAVRRVSKAGGDVQTLASGLSFPFAITVSEGYVYFSEAGVAEDDTNAGLRRVPSNGGEVTNLFEGAPVGSMAVDDSNVYFAIYRLDSGLVDIGQVPLASGAVTLLETGIEFADGLTIQDGSLYYVEDASEETSIAAIDLASGTPRVVETVDLLIPRLAFDECLVYYASALETIARSTR